MISKTVVKELAQERIDELDKGLFIVNVHVSSTNNIYVDIESAEGNVAIVDCMSVSRNIEHNLDREEQDFQLHVSSPGLDKPFKVTQQYIKNVGRDVKVKLKDSKKIEGLLKSADQDGIVIETTRKERIEGRKKKETIVEEHPYQYSDIVETKIIISFK